MVKRTSPLLGAYVAAFILFQLAPLVVVAGASLEDRALLQFPPDSLSLRWYGAVLHDAHFLGAARNSVAVAVLATLGALVLGMPAAYGVVRYSFPGRGFISSFLMSPLVVPQLVIGIALLQMFASLGIAASILTLTLGHIVITIPYVVRTLSATIAGLDPSIEEAAINLGATRLQLYARVVLPLVRSGVTAAAVFAFLISFDNAVISFFLVSARTTTLPVAIYTYVENSLDPAIAALATMLMAVSIAIMASARRFNLEGAET